MAVAVKNTPGVGSSPLQRPAILSLLGVLYVLAALGVVFKVLPWLWWQGWELAGFRPDSFLGSALVGVLGLVVIGGFVVIGTRLLGTHPPVGVRAGIFVALVELLLVLFLARWVGSWAEHWVYTTEWFTPRTGQMVVVFTTGLLLMLAVYLFTRPGMQGFVAHFEEGGWFATTTYKPSQGQKVRRATVLGVLILGGAGVWTLLSHGTLRRGYSDWSLSIPFLGQEAIDTIGDTQQWFAGLPRESADRVVVRTRGASQLRPGEVISVERYREAVEKVLADKGAPAGLQKAVEKAAEQGTVPLVLTVNNRILASIRSYLDKYQEDKEEKGGLPADVVRNLRDQLVKSDPANVKLMVEAFKTQMENVGRGADLGVAFDLPTAVALVDRTAFVDINKKADEKQHLKFRGRTNPRFLPAYTEARTHLLPGDLGLTEPSDFAVLLDGVADTSRKSDVVRVVREINPDLGPAEAEKAVKDATPERPLAFRNSAPLSEANAIKKKLEDAGGKATVRPATDIVPTNDFEEEVQAFRQKIKDFRPPERLKLRPALGNVRYAELTLMPSVQYTVPLLLIGLSLWVAWRLVNMPTFADFLIATEAELNKVSWPTHKRLVQDTIVVLIALLMMASYLFVVDQIWRVVLSWDPIGVLVFPREDSSRNQELEQKRY